MPKDCIRYTRPGGYTEYIPCPPDIEEAQKSLINDMSGKNYLFNRDAQKKAFETIIENSHKFTTEESEVETMLELYRLIKAQDSQRAINKLVEHVEGYAEYYLYNLYKELGIEE